MHRNRNIDILKGIAIFLVVFGHCIRYGNGAEYNESLSFFSNPLSNIIIAFHMPLFMLISGYLFAYSVEKWDLKGFICNRGQRLLLPIFAWSMLYYIIVEIDLVRRGEGLGAKQVVKGFFTTFWFLWAVLLCSIIVYVIHNYLRDSIIVYIMPVIIGLYTNDLNNRSLYKWLYPYFVIGYLFAKNKYNLSEKKRKICLLALSILFVIMLQFWNRNFYIYTIGYTCIGKDVLNQLGKNVYRFLIGLVGSLVIILAVKIGTKYIPQFLTTILEWLGKNSLGIYIITGYFMNPWILVPATINHTFSYSWTFIETIGELLITWLLIKVICKNNILNRCLLGGR